MKKTILFSMLAAAFCMNAQAKLVFTAPIQPNVPVTLEISGKTSFEWTGTNNWREWKIYRADKVVSTMKDSNYAQQLGLNGTSVKMNVSVVLVQDVKAFLNSKFSFKKGSVVPKVFFGVSSKQFGTLSLGQVKDAADDMGINAFDDGDAFAYMGSFDAPDYSIKYITPEFFGLQLGASLGWSSSGSKTTRADAKDHVFYTRKTSSFSWQDISLAATYSYQDFAVSLGTSFGKQNGSTSMKLSDYTDTKETNTDTPWHVLFTMGMTYEWDPVTLFANMGYVNRFDMSSLNGDFYNFSLPDYQGKLNVHDVYKAVAGIVGNSDGNIKFSQWGGQLGATVNITQNDELSLAVQMARFRFTNSHSDALKKAAKKKDDIAAFDNVSLLGFKVKAVHKFTEGLSAHAFLGYSRLSTEFKQVVYSSFPAQKNTIKSSFMDWGVGLKYEF